jgi:type VI secretion system secreted protein VgrG
MHAEKNMDIRVKNNKYQTVEKDCHLIVQQDSYEHVKNNHHVTIDQDERLKIGKDWHIGVTGKQAAKVGQTYSLQVQGNVTEVFNAGHYEKVGSGYYLKCMNAVIEADMGITLKCGSNSVVIDPLGVTITGSLVVLNGAFTLINSGPGSPPLPGIPGMAVPPAAPDAAEDADKADPGEMAQIKAEQMQTQSGKYGSVKLKPHQSSSATPGDGSSDAPQPGQPPVKKHYIEIKLEDVEGKPVPGEAYKITLPDGGTLAEGTLDEKGFARVDGIDPGSCKVTFPKLDKTVWKPK